MPVAILAERGRGRRPKSLPAPERGRIDYRDAGLPGFMVRVTAAGIRTYCVWFRPRRSRGVCRITLGDVRAMSLADARDEARALLRKGLAGVDPREERRKADGGSAACFPPARDHRGTRRAISEPRQDEARTRPRPEHACALHAPAAPSRLPCAGQAALPPP